jgi:hypothetical protein
MWIASGPVGSAGGAARPAGEAAGHPHGGDPGGEPFEVALLLGVECARGFLGVGLGHRVPP